MKSQSRAFRVFFYLGPLVLWMGLIFFMSTDRGSADETTPMLNSILRRVFPGVVYYLNAAQIDRVDWNIRKIAHITEYALLAIWAFRAVAFGKPAFRSRTIIASFLIAVGYAASDEFHQSFVPSRGASAADVFFDTFGVLVGLVLCLWQDAWRRSCAKAILPSPPQRPDTGQGFSQNP